MKPSVRHSQGVALVLVLAFLALISALVLAFFSSVTTELAVSRSHAAGADTKALVDTAVDVVSAQIREATAPLPKGAPLAWASQPGMIRVFGTATGASSEPFAYYKLYSSDKMVITKDFTAFRPQDEIAAFATTPELYADINKPVLVQDPEGGITVDTVKHRAVYPVLDPKAIGFVEGFGIGSGTPDLINPPGYAGPFPIKADYNPVTGPNPAPMPVKWLYVLKDGTLIAPTGASKGVSTFAGANAPTRQNPIVGRIAFWTDDETSKVNINTASEGTFWDTPLTSSYADSIQPHTGLGKFQPTQGEFQRYPGHPSTTCLSPILGRTLGWTPPGAGAPINYADANYLNLKTTLYGLVPRVNAGGSMSATVDVTTAAAVAPEFDRLYSSVDELMFKPAMGSATTGVWPSRQPSHPSLTAERIQQVRFFLTANSRAPELNLFGRPRIGIWPVNTSEAMRSAKDNVFAFCSTIGSKSLPMGAGHYPFFFARSDSKSPDKDYLDAARNGRNMTLYKYLQDVTSQKIPGFGGASFLSKYPDPGTPDSASDRDQILTEIFDYIRCVNLSDGSGTGGQPFTPPYLNNDSHYAGQVTPIEIGKTRGFGRFPTVSEAVVLFSKEPRGTKKPTDPERMRAVLLLECFTPSFGYMGMKDTYAFRVKSDIKIEDPVTKAPINLFPSSAINLVTTGVHHGMHGRFLGGHLGFSYHFFAKGTKKKLESGSNGVEAKYPFVSDWISYPVPVAGQPPQTFRILGGKLTVDVYAGKDVATDPIVQTIEIPFPNTPSKLGFPTSTTEFEARIGSPNPTDVPGTDKWVSSGDAVRSIEAKTDLRLIAGRRNVVNPPNSDFYFGPVQKARWDDPFGADPRDGTKSNNVLHSLRMSIGQRYLTAAPTGILVGPQGATYPRYKWDAYNIAGAGRYKSGDNQARMPDLPEEVRGVVRADGQPGDWDSGVSKMYDGAFINKTDEGESSDGTSIPYFLIVDYRGAANTLYSPNRIIASPGWFGSLPSGLQRNKPWETLLFRPDTTNHPGLVDPPDHLLLDLFNMPVVEPYPISEPFSQMGKINMNYQIMPFGGYLKRDSAMRAVLRSEKILCIPFNAVNGGKTEAYDSSNTDYRHQIDEDTTLAFLERRWKDTKPENQIFRSATQICELDLYPKPNPFNTTLKVATPAEARSGVNVSTRWKDFWHKTYALTGDNAKERPYARLYSRLTTKSNTYTVHLRVQSLGKRTTDSDQASWNENTDVILGEYRGSAVVERYIDPADRRFNPADTTIPNSEKFNPDQDSLEAAYRYRVLSTKQFVP